jgi:dTDP-4-dehydrorhamnose reductase
MPLELWAGLECTVNRVQDAYFDQLVRSGHHDRESDLDLFASLGIRTLRYPVVWERTAPASPRVFEWNWADQRLSRLRDLGVNPIVGLLHHGSGPRYTNILHADFPEKFAEYARAVAERFPWVRDYTPVNEPLTTARFTGLYGHWHPHKQEELTFARALLNECRATVLAMREIRHVNPAARLVQTEDFGKVFSTGKLAYQAYFENQRRWLSFDLLCGHLSKDDRMWRHLLWCGINESELYWFQENPCPPDILGLNHYVTSDRYLDERVEIYPRNTHGSNGQETYADVEAVRVDIDQEIGVAPRICEMWNRYRLPIAVTEAHLGCAENEQACWLYEVWQSAQRERAAGADVRAVTVWALLGSYDWDCLVTHQRGSYEPGVFDARHNPPRPTALATLVRDLASGKRPSDPAFAAPGWWRRPERILYRPDSFSFNSQVAAVPPDTSGIPLD